MVTFIIKSSMQMVKYAKVNVFKEDLTSMTLYKFATVGICALMEVKDPPTIIEMNSDQGMNLNNVVHRIWNSIK